MLEIINYKYSVEGKVHWFTSAVLARLHFKKHYPAVYANCLDAKKYVQEVKLILPIGVPNAK